MAKKSIGDMIIELKKKGKSKEEIVKHLVKKGVDKEKAESIVSQYYDDSKYSSFEELLDAVSVLKIDEKELKEIKSALKSELEESTEFDKKLEQSFTSPMEKPVIPPEKEEKTERVINEEPIPKVETKVETSFSHTPSLLAEINALRDELKMVERKNYDLEIRSLKEDTVNIRFEIEDLRKELFGIKDRIKLVEDSIKELIDVIKEIRRAL